MKKRSRQMLVSLERVTIKGRLTVHSSHPRHHPHCLLIDRAHWSTTIIISMATNNSTKEHFGQKQSVGEVIAIRENGVLTRTRSLYMALPV